MRVFIAFLMLIAGFGAHGQAVSRTELKNTNTQIDARMALKANTTTLVTASNAILALATVTVPTIADMIALSPATNEVEVTSHHSTNGLGGGRFRVGGTNGYATNDLTIFASTAPRKFWFRKNPSPLNPEWAGAVHDASTDDTVPLQRWLNMLTNGNASASTPNSRSFATMPGGVYRTTAMLAWTNHQPGTSFSIIGEGVPGRGPDGARIYYDGATGGTVMYLMGANSSILENIGLDGNSKAKFGLVIDAENIEKPGAPGSSGMELKHINISGVVGPGSIGIVIGHDTGGSTPQISEIRISDLLLSGSPGSDVGAKNIMGGNTKNFYLENTTMSGWTNDLNFNGCNVVQLRNINGGNSLTNIVATAIQLKVDGYQNEGSSNFLRLISSGANTAIANLSAVDWNGTAPVGNDDVVIYSQGTLIMNGNKFYNGRTSTSVPNIVATHPRIPSADNTVSADSDAVSITSLGNKFNRATVQPFYGVSADSTNNWLGHKGSAPGGGSGDSYGNFANTNIAVVSLNDQGGVDGALIPFKPIISGGGKFDIDYLHVLGSGVWYSNKLGVGTSNPTNTLDVNGHTSLRSNLFLPNRPTNSAPDAFLAIKDGRVVDTAAPAGGSGLSSFKSNNVPVLASPTILETTNGPGNVSAFSTAIGSDTVKTYWAVNSGVTQGMDTAIAALQAAGSSAALTPFIRIPDDGSLGTGATNINILTDTNILFDAQNRPTFRFTNLRNGARVVFVVTNGLGTGLSVSNVGTTNNIVWLNQVPRANWNGVTEDGESGTFLLRLHCTASNIIGEYFPPLTGNGVVNLTGPQAITGAKGIGTMNVSTQLNAQQIVVTNGMTNLSATAAIESAGGLRATRAVGSAAPGELSLDSTNGFVFSIQSGLMGSNVYFFAPTNVPVGLTHPLLTLTNLVHGAGGWTGTLAFVDRAIFGSVGSETFLTNWIGSVSNLAGVFSTAASNLSYAIGTALTNYVDTASSNRVRVAITGPAFATVAPTGSGGVETFTLTASAALGNWQGLTSHAYTNDMVNVFAAASVIVCDASARTHQQTNRMTAAQTLVHTNFTVGQVSTEIIPGEAAGGAARVLTYAVVAGSLIRTNDSAFIASSGFGISVPAGYALEISAMQKSFLSTNVVDLKIAYQPQ